MTSARIEFSNPSTLGKPPGYSHVVQVAGECRTIYIAGQVGQDIERKISGEPGDFAAQCEQAFKNLEAALTSAGVDFSAVVKVNMYFLDIAAHLPLAARIRDTHVNTSAPPASTAVEVRKFARDGLLFEIDAVAVVPAAASQA